MLHFTNGPGSPKCNLVAKRKSALLISIFFHGRISIQADEDFLARLGLTTKTCVAIQSRVGDWAGHQGWVVGYRHEDGLVTENSIIRKGGES